jgi:ATP-dependent RNA helicase DeaD
MKFEELKIKPAILDGIKKAQYNEMTDIQKQVIPIALEGLDIIGQAPTGTGKTCAFVVPTLEQIDFDDHQIQILVMCPTRELAMQITTEYQKIGAFLNGLKVLTIYGGQKINQQFAQLKRQPQIVVCTTGRILDHLHRKTVNLNHVKTIILDEADEMLDMGFSRDIDNVLAKSNSKHQTILLSATIDKTILDISKKYQKQPNFVKATIALKDIPTISQYYIRTPEFKKVDVIIKLIKEKKLYLVLIFTSTRKKTK